MGRKGKKEATNPVLAANRKANHEFYLHERYEAGIALTGTEVKSARQGGVALRDSYAMVRGGEVYLYNAHISPYAQGNRANVDPARPRKLLLRSSEIRRLAKATEATSMTIVPTRVFLKAGWIKVELAVARGKKLHDKRDATRKKEQEREMARARSLR